MKNDCDSESYCGSLQITRLADDASVASSAVIRGRNFEVPTLYHSIQAHSETKLLFYL